MSDRSDEIQSNSKKTGCPIAQVKLSSSGNFNAVHKNSTKTRFLHVHDNRNRSFVRSFETRPCRIRNVLRESTFQYTSSISDVNGHSKVARGQYRNRANKVEIYDSARPPDPPASKGLIYAKFGGCRATDDTY